MASYSNFGSDYFITFNNGTGTVHVAGNLEVSGNVTYISELSVNDAFIIAGANNSSSANVTSIGFLAGKPTDPISYAGIKYDATADAWQISTDVLSNGTANTVPYANISTSTYGDANVSSLLSAYGSNIISSTGNITTTANISGDYILGNGSQLTGVVSSYGDANVVNLMSNFASNNISMTGNITTGNVTVSANIVSNNLEAGNVITNLLRSDDSTYLTVQDGLNVTGDIDAAGNISGANLIAASNVVFGDGSKFSSASWTLVETITGDLSSGDVNVATTNSFSYYSSNYNEVLYATSYNNEGGTITLPVSLVTNNTVWVVNDNVGIKWANIANAVITLVDIISPTYSATVYMYVR